jgi:hypothetical protein
VVDPKGFDWERPDQGFDASLLQWASSSHLEGLWNLRVQWVTWQGS